MTCAELLAPTRPRRRRCGTRCRPVGAENPDTASGQLLRGQPTDLALTVGSPAQHDRSLWHADSRT
jgi:hypothetical protein